MFRGIARRRFPMLGRGDVFYHLTYMDDTVEGLRLCGETAAAAGRTYLLAGPSTRRSMSWSRVSRASCRSAARLRLPVWPVWLAGALCEAVCVPLRIEPPLYRRRVDFYRKSRAFDISRASGSWVQSADRSRHRHPAHGGLVPRAGLAVKVPDALRKRRARVCDHLGWPARACTA
jgi:hypothetical protein